jgi:hypothetical protein
MIGVLSKESELAVVREFFQLFKTPWAKYEPGVKYDVVISTLNSIPEVDARLLINFGSTIKPGESACYVNRSSQGRDVFLNHDGIEIPVYGELLTFENIKSGLVCVNSTHGVAGFQIDTPRVRILRLGYDLFREVEFLLAVGQPLHNAHIPTLEIHIQMLRTWIVNSGIFLLEIPPAPAGKDFICCLTHDVDFAGIRFHGLDHTLLGFLYRASVVSLVKFIKREVTTDYLLTNWKAVASLPLVYLGLRKDFWLQFDHYLEIEKDVTSTFFIIPFKNKAGQKITGHLAKTRALRYDIKDVITWVKDLQNCGHEIAVHGIDAWIDSEQGSRELGRISEFTGESDVGIRMHCLCFGPDSPKTLEQAGFLYDSTYGYNENIGYRGGTTQVFKPIGTNNLLELPLHIQDVALFHPKRLGLNETQALRLCMSIIQKASRYGGVITIIWHLRSIAPERLWDVFYITFLEELKKHNTWFCTAKQAVNWFNTRRKISFHTDSMTQDSIRLSFDHAGNDHNADFKVRVYQPIKLEHVFSSLASKYVDIPCNGQKEIAISEQEIFS